MRIGLEIRGFRMRFGAIKNVGNRLSLGGRQRRYIYERLYAVILRTGNDSARIRVSRQEYRPTCSLEHAFEGSDVLGKRCEGDRRARYLQSFLSQWQNYVLPARAISPRAVDQHDCRVLCKGTHCTAPLARRNSFIAAAISSTCVSTAKCPVSRNSTRAFGMSFRNASAPAGMKKGSFLPQIASNGGLAFRK